jgi:hypothetical protein
MRATAASRAGSSPVYIPAVPSCAVAWGLPDLAQVQLEAGQGHFIAQVLDDLRMPMGTVLIAWRTGAMAMPIATMTWTGRPSPRCPRLAEDTVADAEPTIVCSHPCPPWSLPGADCGQYVARARDLLSCWRHLGAVPRPDRAQCVVQASGCQAPRSWTSQYGSERGRTDRLAPCPSRDRWTPAERDELARCRAGAGRGVKGRAKESATAR